MDYSGADIYRLMHQNAAGSQDLDDAKDASEFLANGYRDVQDDLMKSQNSLESFWFGSGAENASGGMQPLVDSAIEYGGNLDRAKLSTSSMSFVFNNTRNGLKPMEPSRPECNGLTDYISIGASDAEEAAAQWDADNKHNIQKYESFRQSTDMVKPDLVTDYKPVEPKLSGQQPTTTEPSASVGSASTHAAGSGGGYSGGIPAPTGGGGYAGGAGSPSSPAGYSPAAGASQPPGPPPSHVQQPPAAGTQPSRPGNGTSAAGYAPSTGGVRPGPGSTGFGPAGSGFGPQGSGGSYGAGGSAGGGYGSGGYGAGAYGSGGFGPRGSTPEGPAGGGRASGSAPPASGGSAPRPSPGATPSSAGGSGGGRAPMMGGGGAGRGQGGEAEEHERKYVLPTDDPDDIFGGIPKGSQVVPPVIGE